MDDLQAITRVLIEYGIAIDTHDWPLLHRCFTADVDADYGAAIGHWSSADAITDHMAEVHQKYATTQHRMTNMLIDVDGDRATASTYVDAVLPNATLTNYKHAIGRYEDVFARQDGQWRIARRKFSMAVFAIVPIAGALD